jgi:hypothetical protein
LESLIAPKWSPTFSLAAALPLYPSVKKVDFETRHRLIEDLDETILGETPTENPQ